MALSKKDLEKAHQALLDNNNEKSWAALREQTHPAFVHNSKPMGPEGFVTHAQKVHEILSNIHITRQGIVTSEEEQCVATKLLIQSRPAQPFLGFDPPSWDIFFHEYQFVWFTEGKISKMLILPDHDAIRHQMVTREELPVPDPIGPYTPSAKQLSADAMKSLYEAYIASINDGPSTEALASFCQSQVVHNARSFTLNEYCALIDKDFQADISTLLIDAESQRFGVRLEWKGIATNEKIPGVAPNGRSVQFPEFVMYQLQDGKIARVWSIVDWESFRKQMA